MLPLLIQIQDSSNYVKDACERLEMIKGTRKGESNKTMKRNPIEIRKAFERLIVCLRRAESVLVLPSPTTAMQIYNAEQKVQSGTRKNATASTLPSL